MFQQYVCNRNHDVLIMSMVLNYIAILNVHDADYRCIISRISKSELVDLLKKAYLNEKSGAL